MRTPRAPIQLAGSLLSISPVGRTPRRLLVAAGTVNHCTWRSHNFSHCLETTQAKEKFLGLLAQHKDEHGIEIYSYSVMDSHPHVQCRSKHGQAAFSRFWQIVNYRFARWYNKVHGTRGQVIMERMQSGQVQDSTHQLTVMRYGDLNPVRAGLVGSANHWRWSSHRHYALGQPDPLVTDAPAYAELGNNAVQRRRAYIHLFARRLSETLRVRREDLVTHAFIGNDDWVLSKRQQTAAPPS